MRVACGTIIAGALDLAGMEGINGAVLLIVLGSYLVLKPWFDQRRLFGMAEKQLLGLKWKSLAYNAPVHTY